MDATWIPDDPSFVDSEIPSRMNLRMNLRTRRRPSPQYEMCIFLENLREHPIPVLETEQVGQASLQFESVLSVCTKLSAEKSCSSSLDNSLHYVDASNVLSGEAQTCAEQCTSLSVAPTQQPMRKEINAEKDHCLGREEHIFAKDGKEPRHSLGSSDFGEEARRSANRNCTEVFHRVLSTVCCSNVPEESQKSPDCSPNQVEKTTSNVAGHSIRSVPDRSIAPDVFEVLKKTNEENKRSKNRKRRRKGMKKVNNISTHSFMTVVGIDEERVRSARCRIIRQNKRAKKRRKARSQLNLR